MKSTTLMMTSAFFLASSGAMLAATTGEAALATQRSPESATEIVHGVIQSVRAERNEFTLLADEKPELSAPRSLTIKVNDKTQYTLDGKDSTMEKALKADRRATVSHEEMVAIKVDVMSAKSPN